MAQTSCLSVGASVRASVGGMWLKTSCLSVRASVRASVGGMLGACQTSVRASISYVPHPIKIMLFVTTI